MGFSHMQWRGRGMIRKETSRDSTQQSLVASKNARLEIDRVTQLLEDFCREIDKAHEGEVHHVPARRTL